MRNLEEALRQGLADRYTVGREIGRGGMAVVFHATDIKHGRAVAIKAFRPPTPDPVAKSRFLQEIRTIATLSHPHILLLHDSGDVDGILYFVTPFIDGETLRARLQQGPLPLPDVLRMGTALAGALDHAHRRGVVHRDVKPENILLQDEQALLADFGIAFPFRSGEHDVRLTDGGYRVGTPSYMSPEQIAGAEVDGRSDIYSLGLVTYEMLAGHQPFAGRPPEAVLAAQVSEPPPSLAAIRPGMPPSLIRAVERALAKDPARRWRDAGTFGDAMASSLGAAGGSARRRWPIALAAVAAAATVAWYAISSGDGPDGRSLHSVMIADFRGPAGDSGLTRTVQALVLLALSQSPVISPLPPDDVIAVRAASGIADSVTLSPELARQLAERAGASAVITGEVHPMAGGYSVVLHAVRPADGSSLAEAVQPAENASMLIRATSAAAEELRRKLGERTRSIAATQPLIDVATPSFEAFRKYATALERSATGDLLGSNRLLREAVALDSGFSAAWAQIALNHVDARQLDSAAIAVNRALERPERLTNAARYRLQADAAYALDSDPAAAVQSYDLYLDEVRRSSGGRNNRALFLTMLGRWQEARSEFRRAAHENPRGPAAARMQRLNAISAAVSLGRLDSARAEVATLDGRFREYGEMLVTAAEGHWAESGRFARGVLEDPTAPAWLRMQAVTTSAAARAAEGFPADADRLLARAASAEGGVAARWYNQARVLLALARGVALPPMPDDTTAGGLMLRGLVAGWNGDTATAEFAARELASLDERARRRLGNGVLLVQAASRAAEGDWRGAAAVLSLPAKAGELDAFALDRPSSDLLRWAEARAWLAAGDSGSASRALAPLGATRGLPPNQMPLRGLTIIHARPFLSTQP